MRAKRSRSHDDTVEGEGAGGMPGPEPATTSATAQTPDAKGPIVKTENGWGRGRQGWAIVKEIIELAKTEVISVSPQRRKRMLDRARKEMAAWRRGPQASEDAAQRAARRPAQPGAGRNGLPRRAKRGHLAG